jgi:hypothetical protein
MRSYFLIDGMMAYGVMRAQTLLHDPAVNWCAPVIDAQAYRLTGPMLIDTALAKTAGDAVSTIVGKLIIAFPCRLHFSTIHSHVDLPTLVKHLRRFTAFYDEDAELLALRLADCRRIVDFPQLLTPQQWGDLTSLMEQWYVHNQVFRLSREQIEALQQVAAPDRLLNRLGYTPQVMASNMTAYWQLAQHCIQLWKKSGNTDGDVLFFFARQVFSSQGKILQERDWLPFLAQATSQSVINVNA